MMAALSAAVHPLAFAGLALALALVNLWHDWRKLGQLVRDIAQEIENGE